MDRKILIGIISVLVFISCATKNEFIANYKKKNIKLTSVSNQIRIGYETDKAIIYLGRDDAIAIAEKLLSNTELDPIYQRTTINDLKNNLDTLQNLQKDKLVQHWKAKRSNFNLYDYNFAGFIDQWIMKRVVMKGKAEIFNKVSNKYEKRIAYNFIQDKLGGEQCYYTFNNGVEFHRQLIALGE